MIKRLFSVFMVICVFSASLLFASCGKVDDEKFLSFDDAQTALIEQDTKARIFFNNLDYNYTSSPDYEKLIECTSFIKTLGTTLGEQLSQYKKVINEFSGELETSNTKVTREETLIKIENETQVFEINKEDNSLKIEFKETNEFYLYEQIKVSDYSYICQVVTSFQSGNYTIYQYIFNGNRGKLATAKSTNFVSIYKTDLNDTNYPTASEMVFVI